MKSPSHHSYRVSKDLTSLPFFSLPLSFIWFGLITSCNLSLCFSFRFKDDLIELIFSHSADEIERSPGAEKVEFFGASLSGSSSSTSSSGGAPAPLDSRSSPDMPSEADAFVLVKNLTGLTFSLKKRFDQDSYEIVKVGSFELSAKTQVVLSDPYAVKVLKPQSESEKISQRDRDHLTGIRVYYEHSGSAINRDGSSSLEEEEEEDSISRPVMLATFGPDVRIPGSTDLSIGNGALEVVGLNPPNEYGCEPITQEPVVHKKERPENVNGKVVLVKRGQCTFADKVQNALLAGAKALIVANQDDTLLIPTSDRIRTRDPKEDLSSASSSDSDSAADHQESSSESNHRPSVAADGDNKDFLLNLNLHSIPLLFCTLETGRSIGHLLANRSPRLPPTPSSPQHPRSKKLMLEIVGNPLHLLDHHISQTSTMTHPHGLLMNGLECSGL
ncbi:alpha mannosidase-like protein [Puccinia graminis f. sp. tritici]|uniref:Alpha mannosidase-like protein n=1 Tax=Puccinia graminis f. sp. tritici TaxID=56615 RepID=A0A5B0R9S8_PUCGR|nr:alpha mannosidase-like protein [Puccinia graminis f. sp. tritici]